MPQDSPLYISSNDVSGQALKDFQLTTDVKSKLDTPAPATPASDLTKSISAVDKAQGGDTTAMIWWTKAQMRWSETVKQELTGADGEPLLSGIQVSFVKPNE